MQQYSRPASQEDNPTCYTPADFERRRAEPDSFGNRILSQPNLPLIGDVNEPVRAG